MSWEVRATTAKPDLKKATVQLLMNETERIFKEKGGKRLPEPIGESISNELLLSGLHVDA